MSSSIIAFNKPFRVLSQFSTDDGKATLAEFINVPDFYAAGRLDYDSEGLMLLTNQGAIQHIVASPDFKWPKTYWVQVEGEITDHALEQLRQGVELKDGLTKPAQASRLAAPDLWPRTPPVRYREAIPTSWIALQIHEGKNRQVRRMTAAVGFPTLRLVRYAIGPYTLEDLNSGVWRFAEPTSELIEEVENFEKRRKRKTATPNRRRPSNKTPPTSRNQPVSHGKRVAGRKTGHQPASRTRRK
ncbi:Ribosomal large subunit pseudouridine synthase E [Marinomonas spartinae]|uniref:Pseudouridine synthase n=1 Tax=Marinomonas spartinae TaxID=1792290 RepID=A0A1A8TB48_9GAMM|nr:pseudouridine synthase [Marinomonas spartinae]SBS28792.1 Ribosomal large subunit pseudouridine synthase E [Marinomonas spartinae]